MLRTFPVLLGTIAVTVCAPVCGAVIHYLDDTTGRHVTVADNDFGKVTVTVRFTAPGSSYRWFGEGQRKDKEIIFSQIVGEGQEQGTVFLAKAGESKIEVAYKPGQKMPVDAGINGEYRRISEEKRLSLAKKEADMAEETLTQALRAAPRMWPASSRSMAGEWRTRWPDLRARWMGLVYRPPALPAASPGTKPVPPVGSKPAETNVPAPTTDYWIALVETTGMGIGFINTPLDKTMLPATWDGEYDDSFGGHVSARLGHDGDLRITLTCTRGSGEGQAGELFCKIAAKNLAKEKNGDLTASYTHRDTELKPEDPQAIIKLRKTGHFLVVETQYAQRYHGRAWFDGIYRWSPIPKE